MTASPVSKEGPLQPGCVLGSYEVTEVISLGHSNAVYAAKHKATGKAVAVRILLPQLASQSIAVKRSMHGAKSMARISHPNVAAVFDFGMDKDGLPYTVMERIAGHTMQAILKEEGNLSGPRLRRLFGQICLGMEAVHKANIVHRDLKPANFLISGDQEEKVTIIDFDACKEVTAGSPDLTAMGELVGTPYYMSPEQCMGMLVDHRSDIYAVGCCMFEAMTGAKPFVGATMTDTMAKHVSQYPLLPEGLEPELKGLTSVVLKCLEKEPADRYQSMSELHRALTGKPVNTKPAKNLRNIE